MRLTLIAVSHNLQSYYQLEKRLRSRFEKQFLNFFPYKSNQLIEILTCLFSVPNNIEFANSWNSKVKSIFENETLQQSIESQSMYVSDVRWFSHRIFNALMRNQTPEQIAQHLSNPVTRINYLACSLWTLPVCLMIAMAKLRESSIEKPSFRQVFNKYQAFIRDTPYYYTRDICLNGKSRFFIRLRIDCAVFGLLCSLGITKSHGKQGAPLEFSSVSLILQDDELSELISKMELPTIVSKWGSAWIE